MSKQEAAYRFRPYSSWEEYLKEEWRVHGSLYSARACTKLVTQALADAELSPAESGPFEAMPCGAPVDRRQEQPTSWREIGDAIGCSPERARQIGVSALDKLRVRMRDCW